MNNEKNWNRPWSFEEIIDNSENWSLAGDVALLNTIKQFANNLLTKTNELNEQISTSLNYLNKVELKLDITQNELQSLKNTQFIESRVYDDDETLDSKDNVKALQDNTQKEEEKQVDVSLASEIKLLEKYYDLVEIVNSDSEDESEKSFVLKPKDMYEDRPLPPLIGSEEWYKNWYLEDEVSDLDSQKSEDAYSASNSDDNLPNDMYMSETSSDMDFSQHIIENRPVANSTVEEKINTEGSSEGSDQTNSGPAKVPVSNKMFAEQLSAKLDNVISRGENSIEEINSKPIQPAKTRTFSGLFSNEPPPLSDSEDRNEKDIFSSSQKLFDDDEDSLFWDSQKRGVDESNSDFTKSSETKSIFAKSTFLPKSSQVSKGLFDSDNSDDDMFVAKTKSGKNTFLQPHKTIVPLIDDEPPAFGFPQEHSVKREDTFKKPQGTNRIKVFPAVQSSKPKEDIPEKKVSLFDDDDDDLYVKETSNKLPASDLKSANKNSIGIANATTQKKNKIISLFDDDEDDDDLENDIFKNSVSKETDKKYDLFNDDLFEDVGTKKENYDAIKNVDIRDEQNTKGDVKTERKVANENKKMTGLFEDMSEKDVESKISKKISLFDDDDDDDDDLFSNVEKRIDFKLFGEPDDKNMFSINEDENVIKTAHVEKTVDFVSKIPADEKEIVNKSEVTEREINTLKPFTEKIKENVKESTTKSATSFDDFSSNKRTSSDCNSDSFEIKKESITTEKINAPSSVSLFGSTPPPDEDDWDNKSDTFSDTEDFLAYKVEEKSNPRSIFFDNEPPALNEDESFGTPVDQRILLPPAVASSLRLSSDKFNEEESLESLSVAKTETFDSPESNIEQKDSDTSGENFERTDLSWNISNKSSSSSCNVIDDEKSSDERNNKSWPIDSQKEKKIERSTKKISSITEMLKNQRQKDSVSDIKVSPGKLKKNLDINVNALLPGYSQQKIKSLIKTQSLEIPEEQNKQRSDEQKFVQNKSTSFEGFSGVGLDEPDNVEVLRSITKERVRIPVKRRPSTRKGRHAALRKSIVEDTIDEKSSGSGDFLQSWQTQIGSIETKISPEKAAVVTKGTSPPKENTENSKSVETKTIDNEPTNKPNAKLNLFDSGSESDDGNDLFVTSHRKKKNAEGNNKTKAKKSLFDDSDSDDGLFVSKSNKNPETFTKIADKKLGPTIKRMKNIETMEDPLSNLLN